MAKRDDLIRRSLVGVLAGLLVTLLAGAEPLARAAPLSPPPTFTVNSIADIVASAPLNNGICETEPGDHICTLRAAIMKANNYPGGGVTINLPAQPAGAEYALSIDQLIISNTMTIDGSGAANTIIDGSEITPTEGQLNIDLHTTAAISGVTIQGGNSHLGGGIFVGIGGTLTLRDSIVTSNTALYEGGGIYNNNGTLTVTDSLVDHNTAQNDQGGGIYNGGVTALRRVTVSNNTASVGGGVYDANYTLADIVDSAIYGNEATVAGGGIYNSSKSLSLVNSTVSNNFADQSGAGIYNVFINGLCCTANLYNATIADNEANQAVVAASGGGIFNESGGTVRLQNTLLDANVHDTLGQPVFDDCSGTVSALSYNLFSTQTGCTILGGTHDLPPQPGLAGPLQDNGGPTFTNALLPGSPAIDAGNPGGCTDDLGATLRTDQRGAPRPANGAGRTRCDIGAYELQRTLELPLVRR